jgi:hypothetical protein
MLAIAQRAMSSTLECRFELGQHLANRDGPVALVRHAKVRQVVDDRRVEIDLALLGQLHQRCGDERLGDRRHVEQRAGRDRAVPAEPLHAEAVRIDDVISFDDGNREAGPVLALEQLLDPGLERALVAVGGLRSERSPRGAAGHDEADDREREVCSRHDDGSSFPCRHAKKRSIIIFATPPIRR